MRNQSTSTGHRSNREKLLQQNIKLNKQIHKLAFKIEELVRPQNQRLEHDQNPRREQVRARMNEIYIQENYVKKLKDKIKKTKALNLTDTASHIVGEENEIIVMKRELARLMEERKLMGRRYEDKKSALLYNVPIKQLKSQAESELMQVRRQNGQMLNKIVELQRQVRKYHKYMQLNKKFKDEKVVVENPEYEIAKIQHEKSTIIKQIKIVEQKWKPQLEALDREYFQVRDALITKQKMCVELERELKSWKIRAAAARNESDVLMDRQRLAKVVSASPNKKMAKSIESPRKISLSKQKGQSGLSQMLKSLFNKQKQQNQPHLAEEPPSKNINSQIKKPTNLAAQTRYATQSQQVRPHNSTKYDFTKLSENNQFMNSNNSFLAMDPKSIKQNQDKQEARKNRILMSNSIAVGTSFYYNDDE